MPFFKERRTAYRNRCVAKGRWATKMYSESPNATVLFIKTRISSSLGLHPLSGSCKPVRNTRLKRHFSVSHKKTRKKCKFFDKTFGGFQNNLYFCTRKPETRTFITNIPTKTVCRDLLAQLVEQYTFNVWVLGSSPKQITQRESSFSDGSRCFYFNERLNRKTKNLKECSGA